MGAGAGMSGGEGPRVGISEDAVMCVAPVDTPAKRRCQGGDVCCACEAMNACCSCERQQGLSQQASVCSMAAICFFRETLQSKAAITHCLSDDSLP